jgi:hypothetical protein
MQTTEVAPKWGPPPCDLSGHSIEAVGIALVGHSSRPLAPMAEVPFSSSHAVPEHDIWSYIRET